MVRSSTMDPWFWGFSSGPERYSVGRGMCMVGIGMGTPISGTTIAIKITHVCR